jgi:tRNA(Ile)-lysidine synthase
MSPTKQAADFDPAQVDELFSNLKHFRHLALAVSGGSDSTALMLLAARWKGPVKFSVLSVDHGLRPASRSEALKVKAWAGAMGFEANVLSWKGAKPQSALQALAREARYRLLAQWCAEHGAEGVVTAHTLEDQAETLLMRLARGSGLDGLSAMAEESMVHGLRVLRPLLEIDRRRLKSFLAAQGQAFFDDPSNSNPAFERIRIRQAGKLLKKLGLGPLALARTARRLGRARRALEQATDELERNAVHHQAEGHAIVDLAQFEAAPEEIRLRILSRLLERIGGASAPARLSETEALSAWITQDSGRARTLGGCRVQRRARSLIIGRELGRMSGVPMHIKPGETLIWDDRFAIKLAKDSSRSLAVVPLGEAPWSGRVTRPRQLPDFVFKALPALISGDRLALVPQIGYRGGIKGKFSAVVQPVSPPSVIID